MNNKKYTSKKQQDIKTKLIGATAMLLVSCIMMVSTTYAWFTLSTAPEVTGITTAVGANGNLEMALLPSNADLTKLDDSITSSVGDSSSASGQTIQEANVTWGNLVDLSGVYGLEKITLYPSELYVTGGIIQTAILRTPKYGADGRISELSANTVTAVYSDGAFTPAAENAAAAYGVRAVGTASGMTQRQLDYRNARSAASTAKSQAASAAASALNNNGSNLANIAISYGMNGANAEFTKADVAALRAIVDALQGDGGVLDLIETAYVQYIFAYAASANQSDEAYAGVKLLVEANNATLATVQAGLATAGVTLPDALTTAITSYNTMVSNVAAADTELENLEASTETTFTWEEIKSAMTPLVDPAAMKINGFLASAVKDNLGDLVSSVTSQGGLTVLMETGAGVFADIADHTEDYSASVTINEVTYEKITLNNMTARMQTKSNVSPSYLTAIGTVVQNEGAPASGAAGSMPITDMYGYVIDLAFRTNAAESNLLLQQTAVDRIYSDNSNEDTMGNGASMTFKATTTDFSNAQVKELMDAIRIVFFDPSTSKVISYAKLDTANATSGTDGWTAKIYLYEVAAERTESYTEVADTTDDTKTYYYLATETVYTVETVTSDTFGSYSNLYTESNGTYTAVASDATYNAETTYYVGNSQTVYKEITESDGLADSTTVYTKTVVEAGTVIPKTDNVIMALTQNKAQALSVLVYLDGNVVTNADVAATGTTSITGSMNLQFSSSANLIAMEYADLYTPNSASNSGSQTPSGESSNTNSDSGDQNS